jgi:D-alanyl-D-alanine carboxypeptidase
VAGKTRLDGGSGSAPGTHPLPEQLAGVDGFQAGSVPGGGAHLIATAQRDGRRLVSVVLGAPDEPTCARLSALLLQRGFETPREGAAS